MRLFRLFALGVAASAAATIAIGQVATGTPTFGTFSSGPDVINVGNLNVHLAIPIINKPGRGKNFTHTLAYDSSVWYPAGSSGAQYWAPVANWGWKGTNQQAYITYAMSTSSGKCGQYSQYSYTSWSYSNLLYVDEDGGAHSFGAGGSYFSSPGSSYNCPPNGAQPSGTITTPANDGSKLILHYSVGQGSMSTSITRPTGETINPPTYINSAPTNSGTYTDTDPTGNQITATNGVYKDTTGNVVLTEGGTAPTTATYTYTTSSGASATYTINYSPLNIHTYFRCPGVTEYTSTNQYLVSSIGLPDGTSYAFTYEQSNDPAHPGYFTGRVASITLPSGNTIGYQYTGGSYGITCLDGSTSGLTRTMNADASSAASTWTYLRTVTNGANTSHTDVADGLGNHLQYDFVQPSNQPSPTTAAYYEVGRKVYQGAVGGTALISRSTCYNGAASPCLTTIPTLPFNQIDTYELRDGLQMSGTRVAYDSSGDLAETDVYDFGGTSARGSLLRQEKWTYNTLLHPGLPTSDAVYDRAGVLSGQTTYTYDGVTATASSGVPQHTTPQANPGNMTSAQFYPNSGTYYTVNATYEDTGSLLSVTTPNGSTGFTTGFAYDPTFVYNTGVTFPTPSSGVILSTSQTFDTTYTGLPLVSKDFNTQPRTVVSYDSMLRPTEIDQADGGKTTYTYTLNPLTTTTNTYQNASTYASNVVEYDGYGRLSRVRVANGHSTNPWYQQDYCYDGNGNLIFRSYPYQGTGPGSAKVCSGAGDTYAYDVLGRLGSVNRYNGESVAYKYTGRDIQFTDENGVSRISEVDGLGRPTLVCEVSSNSDGHGASPVGCGTDISGKTGFLTTYSFSLSTGTTTVTQGSQTRTFQHDWLGRPTSVTEPESGTTTYAYTYNSTGLQVTRKKPKANQTSTSVLTTTTTQYDSVGRVLSIQYDDGTPSKYFDYDKSENWSYPQANLKGRLSGTVSPVTLSGADSIYSYDPVGRVSMVAECLPSGCNLGVAHEMDYGYDLAGNLLSSTDGAGIQSTYTVSIANELLSLTSSLNNSTNRPNILSNIQNGPFGPTGYSLGNGLTGVPWYDSAGRYNGGWVCNGSSTHNCMGGTEIQGSLAAWHGTENIQPCEDNPTANNCANAGYDEFGRLKSFASTVGAYTYQYTYDRYGNRWAQTETIGSGGPQPSLSFNSANNQISISGYAYDAAGNLIQDPSHHYTYDAEGNITQVDSGSTAKYYYNSLNQRVRTEVGSSVTEYVFNTAGQRVSIWNGSTRTQLQGQYYWGSEPVAFYSGGVQHFQHQNWLGTERVRTSYSGSVEGQYGSLPFGDGQTSSGSNPNTDAYHFADLDHDSETNTEHAYFRQFAGASGRWLSPDSYFGSYDSSNPQSLNRYTYVLESGLVYTDRLGLSANNSDCSAGDTVCVDGCDDPVASIVCISGGGFGWGGFGGGTGGGGGGTGGGGGGGASSSGTTNGQQKSPARQACEANEIAYANRVRDDYFDGTSDRILSATFTGAKAGAVSGAMRGFMGGELLEPIGGGIPGALAGGFIGGVAGAGGAVLKQGAQEMLGGYLYDHSFLGFGNTYQKQLAANIQKRCGGL